MKFDGIILKFGELFLKGKNRYRFIDRCLLTTQNKLKQFPELTFAKDSDHLNISLNGVDPEPVLKQLNFVFGLHSYQLYCGCAPEIEAIKATTLAVVKTIENDGKSIKVLAKRGDKRFPLGSPEINRIVGTHVAENSCVPIDLVNPQVIIKIMVRHDTTYVISREYPAAGGLPIGLNGKSLLMLSGGLDSPVAGYYMMKRGLAVEAVHFDSPPYTSPRARQKVYDIAEKLAHYMPNGRFVLYLVPFTKLQKEIFTHVPDSYGMTIMRRMMYRISEGVARRVNCQLLSNGESLGQVASQTPQSMFTINSVIRMPTIRPVACMDKPEIIAVAEKINTFDISIRPFEDCCTVFLPKSPATAPKPEKCTEYEKGWEWESMIDECIRGVEKIVIEAGKPLLVDTETSEEICALL